MEVLKSILMLCTICSILALAFLINDNVKGGSVCIIFLLILTYTFNVERDKYENAIEKSNETIKSRAQVLVISPAHCTKQEGFL